MKKSIAELLNKPMDRQEFLRYIGTGFFVVIGGGALFQLVGLEKDKQQLVNRYGMGTYGGKKSGLR